MEGIKDQDHCPELSDDSRQALKAYLAGFHPGV
jgi:hypothetical protein